MQDEKCSTPRKPARNSVVRHVRNVFIAGTLIAVPVAVTYLVFRWLFDTLDGILQPIIVLTVGRPLPGVGLVGLLVVVYLLGLVAANVFGRRLIRAFDAMLCRLPIVQYPYTAARQVVDSVRSLQKAPFKQVVIIEFPRAGVQSVAFVTGKPFPVGGEQRIPVFVPTAPNPISGFLLLVPPKDLIDTRMAVDEAMRMVVSGGLLSPNVIRFYGPDQAIEDSGPIQSIDVQ
ncbi:MAG: DUF502 domain-containing protein [Chloroflexi bacterium]|nr:DUF502 domain-containing protein [Chloroflexota bacterium]